MTHIETDTRPSGHGPRVLLLIPSHAKVGVADQVAVNAHPTMDYYALQATLQADLVDYRRVEADPHPLIRVARAAGLHVALAMYAFVHRYEYDVIFSNSEHVSIPLAALLKPLRKRPRHVLIAHRVSPKKKRPFLRALHSEMDAIFVYAATQKASAEALGIPSHKLHLIPFHADARFFAPMSGMRVERRISSAGLELRDYPTLIEAVSGLDLEVRLAAASPWSKRKNETADRTMPVNVHAKGYNYRELRDLYASSQFIVVPLYENDFQAGVTTMLEAMAMGKAVIASQTTGQRDVIRHNDNGLYVPPGDTQALRTAIVTLLEQPEMAARLGANGRRTIETEMSLELWVERIARVIREVAAGA